METNEIPDSDDTLVSFLQIRRYLQYIVELSLRSRWPVHLDCSVVLVQYVFVLLRKS